MSTTTTVKIKPLTVTSHDVFEIFCEDQNATEVIETCLERFIEGDWGDVSPADARRNTADLDTGGRLLAAYNTPYGRIWIVGNATDEPDDPRRITIMTPEEY